MAWDKAGAPVGIDDLIWGQTIYAYDANGQVAKAEFGDGFTEKFDYDAAKNVAGVKLQGPEIGPGLGGLLAWRSTAGGVVQLARGPNGESIALTHDVCGRVVTRRVDGKGFRPKTWHYGWDALDRLVSCETPEGDSWFYRYDPFDRRSSKVRKLRDIELAWTAQKFAMLVPERAREATKIWTWPSLPVDARADHKTPPIVGTIFTWDGDVLAEEAPLRLNGTVCRNEATKWFYLPGRFVPTAVQEIGDDLLYTVADHIDAPRETLDEHGLLKIASIYNLWGSIREIKYINSAKYNGQAFFPRTGEWKNTTIQENMEVRIRGSGQYNDEESGLHYNRYRYYDPLGCQYITKDPIGLAGGYNIHAFVSNPCIMVDPMGLKPKIMFRDLNSPISTSVKAGFGAITGAGIAGAQGGVVFDPRTGEPIGQTQANIGPFSGRVEVQDSKGVTRALGFGTSIGVDSGVSAFIGIAKNTKKGWGVKANVTGVAGPAYLSGGVNVYGSDVADFANKLPEAIQNETQNYYGGLPGSAPTTGMGPPSGF